MAKNAGFCLFFDWVEVLNDLDPADAMTIITALADYEQHGIDPVEAVPKSVRPVMRIMYQQIKRREEVSEARAKAGRASAESRSADVCSTLFEQNSTSVEQKATTITKTKTITETDNNTSSYEEDKPKRLRFVAPSTDEVREYAISAGLRIDSDAFVDHYQAVGWRVGNKPMEDWKAAVRNWARRDVDFNRPKKEKKQTESSFDTDDFMLASLKRVYGEAGA